MLLCLWIVPLMSLVNCAHEPHNGPMVKGCVVDIKDNGYQCASTHGRSFLTWNQGKDLHCAAPSRLEVFLKACKQKKPIPYPDDNVRFDNDFCLSDQDLTRLLERCQASL